MEHLLERLGLSQPQANAYLYILSHAPCSPPKLAAELGLTRSNAYKILDRLTEMALVERREVDKKFIYEARDPASLHTLLASEKDRVANLEKALKGSISELQKRYLRGKGSELIHSYTGSAAQSFQSTYKPAAHSASVHLAGSDDSSGRTNVSWHSDGKELIIIKQGGDAVVIRIRDRDIASAFKKYTRSGGQI